MSAQNSQIAGSSVSFKSFLNETRNDPIYVIIGVQGSGTNLLARLLTRLFNFSVMRDRSAVFRAAARLGESPQRVDIEREIGHFNGLVRPSKVRRLTTNSVIRKSQPFAGVELELQPEAIRSGADFARFIYTYRAFSLGATRIGIKSDDLWESIHDIDVVIPNRRVIFLTRDFRDNLISISGKPFGPIEPVCAAEYVKRQLAHYTAVYRRSGSDGYHIKYETLLTAPRQFAEDFASYFGLVPPPPAALAALQFRPNKIGRWKSLSSRQLAWCEGILQEELREFGYPFASTGPRLPTANQRRAANARDTIKRVPQKVRSLVARIRS